VQQGREPLVGRVRIGRQVGHQVDDLPRQERSEEEDAEDRDAVRRGHHDSCRGSARDAAPLQSADEGIQEVADGHAEHERQHDGADQPQRDRERRQESEPEVFGMRSHGTSSWLHRCRVIVGR